MTVTRSFLSGVLFALALGLPASASSLASVSGSVGATTCSRSDPNSAICNININVYDEANSIYAVATATWALNGSGTLEAQVRSYGSTSSGLADVSFSNPLIVTGTAGSGTLQIVFSGSQTESTFYPGTVSPVGVSLGSFSTNATLPNGTTQTFSVTAPITFNAPTLFSVAFGASASGGYGNDSAMFPSYADGILRFPTFVATDASGNVLRSASVQFVPEPATWFFVVLGLVALPIVHRVRKQLA